MSFHYDRQKPLSPLGYPASYIWILYIVERVLVLNLAAILLDGR
jgi:hypothetical protein